MKKILIGYPLDAYKEFEPLLRSVSKKYTIVFKDYSYAWLNRHCREFTVIVPSLKVRIDEACIREASSIRLIISPTTGTDHIRLGTERENGIPSASYRHYDYRWHVQQQEL